MPHVVKDRVMETTSSTGTGTITLGGAVVGYQSFSVIGNANTTYYAIVGGSEWEVGLGTYTSSGTTLSRTTVLESSNSGGLVNFSSGTKNVFVTYPAEKSVTTDDIGTIASQNSNNVSITGGSITVTEDPSAALQVATKQYVDAAISGLHVHDAVAAATTAALSGTVTYNNGTSGVGATLTLGTALTVLDGYTLLNGDRVLVKNQANAAHNGIYTWATGGTVLTRAADADTTTELNGGDFFFVVHGTVNNDTGWVIISPVTTIGTSDITFTQFSGAGTYTAGTGLTLTGSQFSLTTPVAISNGGTGQTTRQAAMDALAGAVTSGQYLRGDGSDVVMSTIQAGDIPTLNQNTTGSAATFTSTTQNSQFNSIGVGTAASTTAGEIRATNNITAFFSDDRLKTRHGKIENALDKLQTLDGFYYTPNQMAQDLGYAPTQDIGVSAQAVQAILPEVVAPAPIDDKYLTVRYEKLVPLLIEAIKELSAKVESLETK